jgi:hypothetical protein
LAISDYPIQNVNLQKREFWLAAGPFGDRLKPLNSPRSPNRPSIVSNSLTRASATLNALFVNVMAISA